MELQPDARSALSPHGEHCATLARRCSTAVAAQPVGQRSNKLALLVAATARAAVDVVQALESLEQHQLPPAATLDTQQTRQLLCWLSATVPALAACLRDDLLAHAADEGSLASLMACVAIVTSDVITHCSSNADQQRYRGPQQQLERSVPALLGCLVRGLSREAQTGEARSPAA